RRGRAWVCAVTAASLAAIAPPSAFAQPTNTGPPADAQPTPPQAQSAPVETRSTGDASAEHQPGAGAPEAGGSRETPSVETPRRVNPIDRLAAVYRRLYVLTEAETRPDVLIELLDDTVPSLRRLGLELARRELSSGVAPPPKVIQRAVRLLQDLDAGIRAESATLIAEAGDANVAPAVVAALDVEADPTAAAALLRAVARWPELCRSEAMFRWLFQAPETEAPAIAALWSMAKAGRLQADPLRGAIAEHLRQRPFPDLPGAGVRLLAWAGEAPDRTRIEQLLASDDARLRFVAAETLAEHAGFAGPIATAAAQDDALIPAAVRAAERDRPTPELLATIAGLPFATQDEADRAMNTLIAASDPAVLVVAAEAEIDPTRRLRYAEAAASRTEPDEASPSDLAALHASALELMARAHLDLQQHEEALAALVRRDPFRASEQDAAEPTRLRTLIALGRFADAIERTPDAGAWLDALEMLSPDALPEAIAFFQARFDDDLDEGQRARLGAVVATLPRPSPDSTDEPQPDDAETPTPVAQPDAGGLINASVAVPVADE
ncbi:MAG: hypothetical protein AAGK04_09365, partial [Planctomycetota bacterium]